MKGLFAAMACAGVLVSSGVSWGAQISSPMAYGTLDQVLAECAVVNGGTAPQAVKVKLVSEFGETIGPLDCGGSTLGAGEFCSLVTLVDNTAAYACIVTAGTVVNLRGGLVFHRHVVDNSGILVLHPIRFAPLR